MEAEGTPTVAMLADSVATSDECVGSVIKRMTATLFREGGEVFKGDC